MSGKRTLWGVLLLLAAWCFAGEPSAAQAPSSGTQFDRPVAQSQGPLPAYGYEVPVGPGTSYYYYGYYVPWGAGYRFVPDYGYRTPYYTYSLPGARMRALQYWYGTGPYWNYPGGAYRGY